MADGLPDGFLDLFGEGGPDAIVYAEAAGSIRYWNAAAMRIFGGARWRR